MKFLQPGRPEMKKKENFHWENVILLVILTSGTFLHILL
jgi:hypothetical protein